MPAELCPRCGAARTASGCYCSSDPSAETAVLPSMEGPPLVRPYVAAAPPEQPGSAGRAQDPFATRVMPPVAAPPVSAPPIVTGPVPRQPAAPPAPPVSPSAATALIPAQPGSMPTQVPAQVPPPPGHLPPVPGHAPAQPYPAQPHAGPGPEPVDADQPWEDDRRPRGSDLGMFAFHEEDGQPPLSRSERRSQQQAGKRRLVIVGAAVGLAAVGAGLALALNPAPADHSDRALPAPTDSGLPYPGPSVPTTDPSLSASPAPASSTRTSRPPTSKAPQPATTAPAAPATTAPSSSAPKPSPSASTPTAAPSPRDLRRGDQGPDVTLLQTQLVDAMYWAYNDSLVTGTFDKKTEQAVRYFQRLADVSGEDGWCGPRTRTALTNYP
ncbi:peptidoglycan-binding domain-containing protein [Kitasatospora cinereorecta]|uniref:Peptidoglycan-binding protein n=1 Tax=Kitasatospora cinereorecta TaxID=285560 RepID=A0ABW0VNW8_9ACTN